MNKNDDIIAVGVIGVGAMGQHHARIIASMPGVRLAGVADPDLAQAQRVASQYGVPAFRDYREMLGRAQAFTIAAPTSLHHAIGMDCIRHNAHTLIEKPLASTVPHAKELTEAAAAAGTVLQVGHVERFNPTFSELVKVLANQRILAVEARRLSPFVARVADVSAVFDLMVHDLDLLLALVKSPVTSIQAAGIQAKVPCLDHVSAHLLFANGVVANLTASKISQQKVREITVICDEKVAQADLLARTVVVHRQATSDYRAEADRVLYRQEGVIEQVYVPLVEPLYAEISHFLKCVRNGEQPLVGGREAIRVLELAEAIEQAATPSHGRHGASP